MHPRSRKVKNVVEVYTVQPTVLTISERTRKPGKFVVLGFYKKFTTSLFFRITELTINLIFLMDCSNLVGFVMEFYSTLTLAYQTHIQSQEKKTIIYLCL